MTNTETTSPEDQALAAINESRRHIENFMETYRPYPWQFLAERVKTLCEQELEGPSIPAAFSYRPKSPKSLQAKLDKLHAQRPFKSLRDIMDRVPDLAGVRIALYFPGQRDIVAQVLRNVFDVFNEVEHPKAPETEKCKSCNGSVETNKNTTVRDGEQTTPYKRLFPGYQALHLHVRFKKDNTPAEVKGYHNIIDGISDHIEIQIQSLVIHAWAQIEHDILYKPSFVETNEENRQQAQRLLDALNGQMITAGLLLDQLDQQYQRRITQRKNPFESSSELGHFLHHNVNKAYLWKGEPRLRMLNKFLGAFGKNTEADLQPIITNGLDLDKDVNGLPNTLLWKIVSEYSLKPVQSMLCSFGIMAYIMSQLSRGEITTAMKRAESNVDIESPCYRLKVMLSSMLWLVDLSTEGSEYDAVELCRNAGMSEEFIDSPAFRFLFDGADRTNVLKGRLPDADHDKSCIDEAWKWFEDQVNEQASTQSSGGQGGQGKKSIFAFLHTVSRMGVLRDLPDALAYVPRLADERLSLSNFQGVGDAEAGAEEHDEVPTSPPMKRHTT